MTSQFFADAGIRPEIAKAYSFNERVVQAELAYRHGVHSGIGEQDVVKSINNLVASVGAPVWAKTNPTEVRKLRMLLIIRYPHMMASEAPPDKHGRYQALNDTMSPLEATYVAGSMIQQKLLNPEFQFSSDEQMQPDFKDGKHQAAQSAARTAELQKTLYQQSSLHSVRDLLHTSDGFFTDLGISQIGAEAAK